MEDKIKQVIAVLGPERVKMGEKLSYHAFSQLGGEAAAFFIATNQKEFIQALDTVYQLQVPYYILGNGTKMLIPEVGLPGLVIKNRTSAIKIGGIKGKVGREGLGIEEATLEVDSGVSLGVLNEYLSKQNLQEIIGLSSTNATLGGSLLIDPVLSRTVDLVKVWEAGDIFNISPSELKKIGQVIISVVLKVKAK